MAKAFQVTPRQRRFNAVVITLLQLGIPLGPFYRLSVQGRKTGQAYHLPVTPIKHADQVWLVSPYGEVSWVRNARATGRVSLQRGLQNHTYALQELNPGESAPILKEYLTRFAMIVRPYFDVTPQSSLVAFSAEAPAHPVFQLMRQ